MQWRGVLVLGGVLFAGCAPEPEGGACFSYGVFAVVGSEAEPATPDELQALVADLALALDAQCEGADLLISCSFNGARDKAACEAAIADVDVDTAERELNLRCDARCEF